MLYQMASSFHPRLSSAVYVGTWESQNTILGLVTVPYHKKKRKTSVSFGRDGQLLAVHLDNRSLSTCGVNRF